MGPSGVRRAVGVGPPAVIAWTRGALDGAGPYGPAPGPPEVPPAAATVAAAAASAARPPPTFPRPMVTIFMGPPTESVICLHKQTYAHNLLCQATIKVDPGRPQILPAALPAHPCQRPPRTGVLQASGSGAGRQLGCAWPGAVAQFSTRQGHLARERPVKAPRAWP